MNIRECSAGIAVFIPSYKVCAQVLAVIDAVGPEVPRIYVVDDKCPEGSGDYVEARCTDPRVESSGMPRTRESVALS